MDRDCKRESLGWFRENLKRARKAKGFSQEMLCEISQTPRFFRFPMRRLLRPDGKEEETMAGDPVYFGVFWEEDRWSSKGIWVVC